MELVDRLSSALSRRAMRAEWRRHARHNSEALGRLDRAMGDHVPPPVAVPSLAQIALDLRRLDRQRRTRPTTDSPRWLAAVEDAYDQRLVLACRLLDRTEHLHKLDGTDREAERVRVHALLVEQGLLPG